MDSSTLQSHTTVIPAPPDLRVWIVWRFHNERDEMVYELTGPHQVLAIATTVSGFTVSPGVRMAKGQDGRSKVRLANVPSRLEWEANPQYDTSLQSAGPSVAFLTDAPFDGMATSWASTNHVRFNEADAKELLEYENRIHTEPAQSNAQLPADTPSEDDPC